MRAKPLIHMVGTAGFELATPCTQCNALEQVRHTLSVMPADTDLERRDRALVAFTLLTGARDAALASRTTHV